MCGLPVMQTAAMRRRMNSKNIFSTVLEKSDTMRLVCFELHARVTESVERVPAGNWHCERRHYTREN